MTFTPSVKVINEHVFSFEVVSSLEGISQEFPCLCRKHRNLQNLFFPRMTSFSKKEVKEEECDSLFESQDSVLVKETPTLILKDCFS